MGEDFSMKRRFPRIPSHNALLVHQLDDVPIEEFGRTHVVGLGGCMFTSNESFGIGSHLQILITINREVVESHAKVVWQRDIEDGGYEVGVEFTSLNDAARVKLAQLFEQTVSS